MGARSADDVPSTATRAPAMAPGSPGSTTAAAPGTGRSERLGDPPHRRGHDGAGGEHRLDDGVGERFGDRRQADHVRAAIGGGDVVGGPSK